MAKKKNLEDIYYPVPQNLHLTKTEKPQVNKEVIKRIIQATVKGAYRLKNPSTRDYRGNSIKARAVATQEQIDMIVHLIESLQPADAIEAALASQFVISYIRGLEESNCEYSKTTTMIELFEFSHQVLETLQKYRSKGAQQISVNYNVNQGQVVNIKNVNQTEQPLTLEGQVI
jgi:putative lipoic acid-binding regulatory protein